MAEYFKKKITEENKNLKDKKSKPMNPNLNKN